MTPAEQLVFRINEVFGCLIGFAIFILAIKKIIRNSLERFDSRRRDALRPLVYLYLIEGGSARQLEAIRPRWPGDRQALLRLFLKVAETIEGDVSWSLCRAFQELGLMDFALHQLKHPKWWIRAESAYQLGLMNNPLAVTALEQALEDPHREVVISASRALSYCQGTQSLAPILSHFHEPSRWATLEVAEILFSMGNQVVPQLLEMLHGLPVEAQRLVIEILCHFRDPSAMKPLVPYLVSRDKEVRAKTIKALGVIRNPAAAALLEPLLYDGDWQIRLLTCSALGQLKASHMLADLAKRLRDSDVRVRQRAVEVLESFGEQGQSYLKETASQWDEPLRRLAAPFKIAVLLFALLGSLCLGGGSLHAETLERRPAPVGFTAKIQPSIPTRVLPFRRTLHRMYFRRPWDSIPRPVSAFLEFYNHTVLYYFFFLNALYLVLFIVSFFSILRYLELVHTPFTGHLLRSPMTLPISMLVPAFNEAAGIVESVRSYLNVQFREFEVIVINDGSKDRTFELLQESFDLVPTFRPNPRLLPTRSIRSVYRSVLHPRLLVINKDNGGKSDALNAGLNLSRYPLVCAVDADSILEPQALLRVVRPFMTDPEVVAVGGVIRIANGNHIRNGHLDDIRLPSKVLPLFQIVEYLRAFFSGRMAWSAMRCLMLISGAFGVFRKEVVLACGGYRTDTVGEDMDLVVRMHRHLRKEKQPYRMVFIPDPICWTEAPETMTVLREQRDRWQRGLFDVLWTNRDMWFNPRYGRIGLFAMPYFILVELFGPIFEFGGYVAVLLTVILLPQDFVFLRLFFMTAILFGILLSIGAVVLEELAFHRYPRVRQMFGMVCVAALENLGYRQIHAWWRFRGIIRAIFARKGWGKMVHKGVGSVAALVCLAFLPSRVGAVGPLTTGGLYEQGMQERRDGHLQEAARSFEQMLALDPKSGGALEGLALVSIAQGRYAQAQKYLEQWNRQSPNNPYILGLLARVYRHERATEKNIETTQALTRADPGDLTAQERLKDLLQAWRSGIVTTAKIRKSVGPEGLGGPSPQRIDYEGRSGGADARFLLRQGLFATAGVDAVEDAQRNDTGGFTYYDVLEQIYSFGLEARPTDNTQVQAAYGQDLLSDVQGQGVGRSEFSRARMEGRWDNGDTSAHLKLTRAPSFLRGAGGDRYFAVLTELSAEADAATQWADWDWRLTGGVDHYSEGTVPGYGSFQGQREFGDNLFVAQASHSQQEFYGATPDGKLGLVDYNQGMVRWRRWLPERYRIDSSYDYAEYNDGNHRHEVDAKVTAWLPFYKSLGIIYRFALSDYGYINDNYNSTDERGHFVGGQWHVGWGHGLWTTLGYEHGFRYEATRQYYEDNTVMGDITWFIKDRLSMSLQARGSRSTLHDLSHMLQLEGRYTF